MGDGDGVGGEHVALYQGPFGRICARKGDLVVGTGVWKCLWGKGLREGWSDDDLGGRACRDVRANVTGLPERVKNCRAER